MESQMLPVSTHSKPSKRTIWQQRFTEWRRSGLGPTAWCRKAQVPLSSFYYWRSQLCDTAGSTASPASPPHFIPITLRPSGSAMTIRLDNALSIDVAPDIDRTLLRDMVALLRDAP